MSYDDLDERERTWRPLDDLMAFSWSLSPAEFRIFYIAFLAHAAAKGVDLP